MKNIVIVLGSYHPKFSAVASCVRNVVDELKKKHNITVIANKNILSQPPCEQFDGYTLIHVSTRLQDTLLRAQKKASGNSAIGRRTAKLLIFLISFLKYTRAILQRENVKRDWVRAYHQEIKLVNSQHPIDCIICASFPAEAVIAGAKFKKEMGDKVTFLPYLFDNFTENTPLHRKKWNRRLKYKRHLKIIEDIICASDKTIAIHTNEYHFSDKYPHYANKICYVEHPLLTEKDHEKNNGGHQGIRLFYGGSLLKGVHATSVFTGFLSEIFRRDDSIKANLYVRGNQMSYIDNLCEKYPSNAFSRGIVPAEIAEREMAAHNILLSISDFSGKAMSSKIFTYMSLGKPIISIYNNECDVDNKILSRYPLCFSISISEIKADSSKLDEALNFIKQNSDKTLDFYQVASLYPEALPSHTSDLIDNIIAS